MAVRCGYPSHGCNTILLASGVRGTDRVGFFDPTSRMTEESDCKLLLTNIEALYRGVEVMPAGDRILL